MLRFVLPLLPLLLFGCAKPESSPFAFKLLRKETTGLDFDNTAQQSAEINVFNYMYFYNGGGVAAGDFNNDGLIDLFFTSNLGPDKLFINQGNLLFQDVSERSNVNPGLDTSKVWKTGVSVVDINNDGLLDLYISQVGDYKAIKGRNRLLVCQKIENGIPIYKEDAATWGIDLVGFGTQAAFFDYDGDGDLDMFQLNHSLHQNGTFGPRTQFEGIGHRLSGDRFLENRGSHFEDVTGQVGIESTVVGYGLGIALGDLNLDGWPDLYIGNDFHENDYLYLNSARSDTPGGKRFFKESLRESIAHTSRFSMGVDIGDVNNDGWSDVISLDMEPEDASILKASLGEDGFAIYQMKLGYGYHNQYARNALQLNGGLTSGRLNFQEIAQFAGVSATDWSWSSIFLDFDSDGQKDLFISNGIPRRMNDVDYVQFQESKSAQAGGETESPRDRLRIIEKMPRIKIPNKFFQNSGNLRFNDIETLIRDNAPSFSNGAIYADLDNDGDLDIVVNNIEDEPFVYQNLDRENGNQSAFLSLNLKGSAVNLNAIGARVIAFMKNGEIITSENYPVRGYQSSALIPLHLGIGAAENVDSVLLIWPDRSYERLENPSFNQISTIAWKPRLPRFDFSSLRKKAPNPFTFKDITAQTGLGHTHIENPFVEFNREPLIPHMVSAEGPALAVGDVNGDGLEDVFFGSSKREKSALYLQKPNGTFRLSTPAAFLRDSIFEDVDAVFADLDNDGDLDLLVAAGGNEYRGKEEAMKQRYYLNDGRGNFERRDFPGAYATASCVLPCDFNGDGLIDVFIGARAVPWNYGLTPRSYLFLNKGNGVFEEVAEKIGGGMHTAGMVKHGAWADMDGDGAPDLVLAIEWEPITFYLNQGGKFEQRRLNDQSGWWNFVLPFDADGDGDMDILAGNTGENNKLKPTPKRPLRMYVADFDDNGQIEQLLTYYVKDRELPFNNHAEIMKQLPHLKKRYLYAKDFAKASITDLLGADKMAKAVYREANTLQNTFFENRGALRFEPKRLPDPLQFSSLNACAGMGGNGQIEVLLGGNFYECNIEMGRYDANFGNVLRFGKNAEMQVFPLGDLRVLGQVRRIRPIVIGGKPAFILARNNNAALIIQ